MYSPCGAGPKVYALQLDNGQEIVKVRGLHEPKLSFNDLLELINGGTLTTNHKIWIRDMEKGNITMKDQLFTIAATSNKREIVRDEAGRMVDTKPYNINSLNKSNIINKVFSILYILYLSLI